MTAKITANAAKKHFFVKGNFLFDSIYFWHNFLKIILSCRKFYHATQKNLPPLLQGMRAFFFTTTSNNHQKNRPQFPEDDSLFNRLWLSRKSAEKRCPPYLATWLVRLQHHQRLTAIGLNYFTFTLQHEESRSRASFFASSLMWNEAIAPYSL